jgi:hypothetical protein
MARPRRLEIDDAATGFLSHDFRADATKDLGLTTSGPRVELVPLIATTSPPPNSQSTDAS